MKDRDKSVIIGASLIAIGITAFLFLLPQPFEQEYERMSLAWKKNGLSEEHLHASMEIFSMQEPRIEKIKNELVSFKNTTRNQAARELAGVYILFVENAAGYSSIQKLKSSLVSSAKPLCENISLYEEMSVALSKLKQKQNDYLNAVNSFVSKHPEEAESISLYKAPSAEDPLKPLIDAISVLMEAC